MSALKKTGALGDLYALSPDMGDKYRAADILVTPHVIATRVVREALACGLPIVGGEGNPYTGWTANPLNTDGFAEKINECWNYVKEHKQEMAIRCRKIAETNFNLKQAGKAVKKVFEKIISDNKFAITAANFEDEEVTFAFSAYGDHFMDNVFVAVNFPMIIHVEIFISKWIDFLPKKYLYFHGNRNGCTAQQLRDFYVSIFEFGGNLRRTPRRPTSSSTFSVGKKIHDFSHVCRSDHLRLRIIGRISCRSPRVFGIEFTHPSQSHRSTQTLFGFCICRVSSNGFLRN